MLTFKIDGADVSALVRPKTLQIESALTNDVDTARFHLVSLDNSYIPQEGADVIIEDEAGARVFGGILNVTTDFAEGRAGIGYECECVDFTADLDRKLQVDAYSNVPAGTIVQDWVAKVNELLSPEKQFTTNGVQAGPLAKSLKSNYQPLSLGMEKLHRLTGYEWYPDYHRDVRFFARESLEAPIPLRPIEQWQHPLEWDQLRIRRGPITQIRTQVYVRGATYEGAEQVFRFAGDGKTKIFYLGYLARNVSVFVNAVGPKLLGLDNVAQGREWYFNYEGAFVRQDDLDPPLTADDELQVVATPLYPIRVVVSNEDLIKKYGVREHMVQDQSIDSKEMARLRGKLELRDKGIAGSFQSLVTGWRAGQTFDIELPSRNLAGVKGLVYKSTLQYAGELNRYLTTVQFEVI